MRPGPARGTTSRRDLIVDATMTDDGFATAPSAPLPATFGMLALANTIAQMSRDLLTAHLEDGEILVPGRMEIIQRTPVPVGASVLLEATVQMVEPTRVSIEVLVRTATGVAARGSYEQEVVSSSTWSERVGLAATS
jgi:predicted thioesterase